VGVIGSGRLRVNRMCFALLHASQPEQNQWLSLDGVNVRLRQTSIQIVNDMICRYEEIVDMINRILSHRIRGLKSS
jgi:hypothetical protein